MRYSTDDQSAAGSSEESSQSEDTEHDLQAAASTAAGPPGLLPGAQQAPPAKGAAVQAGDVEVAEAIRGVADGPPRTGFDPYSLNAASVKGVSKRRTSAVQTGNRTRTFK